MRQLEITPREVSRGDAKTMRDAAGHLADQWGSDYASFDAPEFVAAVNNIAPELPDGLREAMRPPETSAGIAVIDGVPLLRGHLGHTPYDRKHVLELTGNPGARVRSLEADIGLILLSRLAGEPFGWEGDHDGQAFTRIVNNIMPIKGKEREQLSANSEVALNSHSEDPFSADRADLLAIACLRNPYAAATTVSSLHNIEISDKDREQLARNVVPILADGLYDQDYSQPLPAPVPILSEFDDRQFLRYDPDYTVLDAADPEFQASYARVHQALEAGRGGVVLEPGQLLLIDNNTVVHGREPFIAGYDGKDRWLKRVNVRLPDVKRPPAEALEKRFGQYAVRPWASEWF